MRRVLQKYNWGRAMRRVLQNSCARGTRAHCVGDEVAEDGADHGGVGDVGERAVPCRAQLHQQLLQRQVNRTQAGEERRGRSTLFIS